MSAPETANAREPRAFTLVRDRAAVLQLEARPGVLRSMAGPPEGWTPPEHPFVDASSLEPRFEDELRTLLFASADVDDFLRHVIAAGYDVTSASNDFWDLPVARRISADVGRVVGVLWGQPGQFASLAWQPQVGDDVYRHATVTAYASDYADALHGAVAATTTLSELEGVITSLGLTLAPA